MSFIRQCVAAPPPPVYGLEWDGNETTNTQRVLRKLSPFACYDATYIFKVYPKGPKSAATNPAYWTVFFWGNYGTFINPHNFYGGHPYPFTGGQNWEISTAFHDFAESDVVGGARDTPVALGTNSGSVTWNRWYTMVFRAWNDSGTFRHELIYDWDLFVTSGATAGWFQHSITAADDPSWGSVGRNPPTPGIVIGEAPPNDANTASWGDYSGREQFKGIIRGIQIYDARLGTAATPSTSVLADVTSELATPGSVRTPWYLNLNPTPTDVTDKSGSGNHFSFPASLPSLWTGP